MADGASETFNTPEEDENLNLPCARQMADCMFRDILDMCLNWLVHNVVRYGRLKTKVGWISLTFRWSVLDKGFSELG